MPRARGLKMSAEERTIPRPAGQVADLTTTEAVQRDAAGSLRVSLSFLSFPQEWGAEGVTANMRFEADVSYKGHSRAPSGTPWPTRRPGPSGPTPYTGSRSSPRGRSASASRLRITIWCIIPVRLHMTVTEFVPGQRVAMEGKTLIWPG